MSESRGEIIVRRIYFVHSYDTYKLTPWRAPWLLWNLSQCVVSLYQSSNSESNSESSFYHSIKPLFTTGWSWELFPSRSKSQPSSHSRPNPTSEPYGKTAENHRFQDSVRSDLCGDATQWTYYRLITIHLI